MKLKCLITAKNGKGFFFTGEVTANHAAGLFKIWRIMTDGVEEPTCFLNQKRAGCHVPGTKPQFKKNIRSATGYIAQINACTTGSAQVAG